MCQRDKMIIKIDENLNPNSVLRVIKDLLQRNHPIGENKALAITIVDIIDQQEIKKIKHETVCDSDS